MERDDFERLEFAGTSIAILREADVASHLTLADAVADLRAAFTAAGHGEAATRPRVRADWRERGRAWMHTLRARLADPPVVGGKDYTSLGFNLPAAWCTVVDATTGKPAAFIEADLLSRQRTAAASALATDLLAPRDVRCLAHFGAGKISEQLVRGMLLVRPSLERVLIVRRQSEVPEWARALGVAVELSDAAAALQRAEIVTTATSSREPVLPPGSPLPRHLNLVGSNHPKRREIDADLARRLLPAAGGCLVVEDIEQAALEAGDFRALTEAAEIDWAAIPTLADLLTRPADLARARSAAVTAFESLGIGLMDLAVAAGLARRLGLL